MKEREDEGRIKKKEGMHEFTKYSVSYAVMFISNMFFCFVTFVLQIKIIKSWCEVLVQAP